MVGELPQNRLVQVIPGRIIRFDQFDLPGTFPLLYLLFTHDGSVDVYMQLEPGQPVDVVLSAKTIDEFLFMLPYTLRKIRSDAGVEYAPVFAGENINSGVAFHDFVREVDWNLMLA